MELHRVPKNTVTSLKDTDVTAGLRNSSAYPKSTQDEAHFLCIGSRANSHSTSYTISGLASFRQLQRFPETPVSSLEEHQFQHSNSKKSPCSLNCLEVRVIPWLRQKRFVNFLQAPQEQASLSNRYVRGTLSLLPQVEWTPRCHD